MQKKVAIAVIQTNPVMGAKPNNIRKLNEKIRQAAAAGANLVVLPELCTTGYSFCSMEEARSRAEPIPEGESIAIWEALCRERNLYLVAGIAELEEDGRLYNSAVLIGPEGFLARHRKIDLWDKEKLYFHPGSYEDLAVVETAAGRLGILICYDMWNVQYFARLKELGAQIVCCPTNWVVLPPVKAGTMGQYVAMASANCNAFYVVAASRVGLERGNLFAGCSLIAGPSGWPVAQVAGGSEEEIILATAELS